MYKNNYINIKVKNIKTIVNILVIILILTSILITPIPGNYLTAQSLDEDLQNIKKEKEETKKKIEEVKKQEQSYMVEVNKVETQLVDSLSQLDSLHDRLSDTKSLIDETTIELIIKEQELKKIDDKLKEKASLLNQRISSIYKNENSNILEILLKAEDFIEFISSVKFMSLIAGQDSKILEEIKSERAANLNIKKRILDLKEKQREREEEISRLVFQAEEKQREIENIYSEKTGLLSKARADKNSLLAIENDLEKKEAEISRILESYRYGNVPGNKFIWPVTGFISSGFGMRVNPILRVPRFHAGIDIVAPNGTPIKAANGGQVIQAQYDRGYGYYILIYHGGGFATRYSHLSGFNISAGQSVERGQVIGFLGSTGWSTGPHLDFEVRINGVPQNPLQYLQ